MTECTISEASPMGALEECRQDPAWTLLLECPDGTPQVMVVCDRHSVLAMQWGVWCKEHGAAHRCRVTDACSRAALS